MKNAGLQNRPSGVLLRENPKKKKRIRNPIKKGKKKKELAHVCMYTVSSFIEVAILS